MADDSNSDLTEFLAREQDMFSQIDNSTFSVPQAETYATTDEDIMLSDALILSSARGASPPPMLTSYSPTQPHVIQRRRSIEVIPPSNLRNDSREASPIMLVSDPYQAVYHEDAYSNEPECIRKWREDKEEAIKAKEDEASEDQKNLREQAQQELNEWYEHHNSQVETRKKENRLAEEAFVSERDKLVPGTEWEKVSNLCDFSGKNVSKTSKDVSRMRSLFLHLKENPPVRSTM